MLLSTIGVDVKLFDTILLVFVLSYIVTRTGDTVPENVVGYNKSVLLRTKLESESKNVTLNTSYWNETSCFDAHKVRLYLLLEETYISASTKYNRALWTWKQMILFLSERMRYREKYAVLVNGHKPNLKAENRPCCFSLFSENRKSEFPDHKTDDVTISWKDVSLRLLQAIVTIFVLYETERKYRENEHDVLNKNNKESNSYKTEKHFLFRFTNSYFRQQYTVYPLSLQKYFKDANNTQGKNKAMNYEWARYGTFLTFPDKSPVTPMRLARAGFYYIGEGEEAVCYSCGLRNHHWSSKETVFDTHKRLSPNCPFIKGTDKTNVPIHDNISNVEITSENSGASGGPEDVVTEICNSERLTDHSDKPTGQNNDVNNDENTTQIHRNTSQHESTNIGNVENISRYQREEPKNPNFTIKSQRMATFSCWPATHPIQPAELAEAGFFFVATYAGPNDLVRCFYCGGGMQSWQPGDNPWVEHARWFPTCAYVRQFKGDNFVNMCRDAHLDPDMYKQLSEPGYDETMSVSSDLQLEDINSTVVSNVLDMGYSQQQVREAIREHRRTLGSTELQTHHLLEYLRDHPPTQPGHVVKKTNVPSKPRENLENKQSSSEDTGQNPLAAENEQLKEKMACKICYDNDANIVFLPCGHMVSCVECAHALRKCAVCRKLINSRIRTYLS